jgi:hypothetical protein
MPSYPPAPLGSRFTSTRDTLDQDQGLAFAQALSEPEVQQAAAAEGLDFGTGKDCVYTVAVSTWAFLHQVINSGKSCVAAVARILVLRAALGLEPCSAATGGYCKARAKLSEKFLQRLTLDLGNRVEDEAPDAWRWKQRPGRVLLVDGFEADMPDTPENQKAYPQPKTQKPGLGFPMIRVVVLLTFATATQVGMTFGPYAGKETGETALLRQLIDCLRPDDIVVADRYYCSYFMIALLLRQGVHVVFRLHQRRKYDFRRGKRLGPDDHIVTWTKPACPKWLDAETYAALPDTLTIREVRVRVTKAGFRPQEIIVATSLVDVESDSHDDIADLYHERWHAELDIRAIKQTLRMKTLTCKTPEMVRKELWMHFLGYNAIRRLMADAARTKGLCPRQLSFAGAMQTLQEFRDLLQHASPEQYPEIYARLLEAIATHQVGNRPDRSEPRKVKRRPKHLGLLTQPRAEARAKLLNI